MSENPSEPGKPPGHRLTALIYLLDLLGAMTVVTAIAGVSLNYARREAVRDTMYASHFDWQIRTFWWALGSCAVGAALILVAEAGGGGPLFGAAGALIVLVALVWFVYRILKGYMWLTAGEPVRRRRDRT